MRGESMSEQRLIDANALLEKICRYEEILIRNAVRLNLNSDESLSMVTSLKNADTFKETINEMPTEAYAGEIPTGKWEVNLGGGYIVCSHCHILFPYDERLVGIKYYQHCPNCMANMRGADLEEEVREND